MEKPTIGAIVIDSREPRRLAEFWAEVLGTPVAAEKGPYVWLRRREGAAVVGFQRVHEPTPGKNRTHFDVEVADPVAEQRRIEDLGGRRVPGYEAGGFLVMADPEGNEFCVIPRGSLDMDDEGHVGYLD
ncbi:VOC family protein [Spirillospora sp. NPDC047279]|uniref:VOC family protein n=1 Tax=Spirillospora sp. NPDC047279 TaxID=3155478 RepID=UPI0033EA12EE